MFADGRPLVLDNEYNTREKSSKIIIPSGTKVVAIHANNTYGDYEGILGSFSNGQVTNATWKCHSSPVPGEWASGDFDDNCWPAAVVLADHGSAPWGRIMNIVDDAKWIWTENNIGDREVYCRVTLLGAQWSSLPSQSVQQSKTCPHSNPHMTPSTTSAAHSGDVKTKRIYYLKATQKLLHRSHLFLCIVLPE